MPSRKTKVQTKPKPTPKNGHKDKKFFDKNGRFKSGNPGGPGNPYAHRTHELVTAARNAVDPETLAKIMRKAADMAMAGDLTAAKLVLDRLLGKPTKHVKIEGDVRQTIEIVQAGLTKLSRRLHGIDLN